MSVPSASQAIAQGIVQELVANTNQKLASFGFDTIPLKNPAGILEFVKATLLSASQKGIPRETYRKLIDNPNIDQTVALLTLMFLASGALGLEYVSKKYVNNLIKEIKRQGDSFDFATPEDATFWFRRPRAFDISDKKKEWLKRITFSQEDEYSWVEKMLDFGFRLILAGTFLGKEYQNAVLKVEAIQQNATVFSYLNPFTWFANNRTPQQIIDMNIKLDKEELQTPPENVDDSSTDTDEGSSDDDVV